MREEMTKSAAAVEKAVAANAALDAAEKARYMAAGTPGTVAALEGQSAAASEAEGNRRKARPSLLKRLGELGNKGLDLLYPPALYCSCCGNLIDETRTYHLCDHCISHIRWDGGPVRVLNGVKTLRCAEYGLYARTLIFALKYNGKTYIARDLAQIMADRLALAELDFDIIVPVPLFSGKEKRRGFNQAALMGEFLGKLTAKPCAARALVRTEDTRPMRGLSPLERQLNVKDKFAVNEKYVTLLAGKRILLIDDFFTTGSTAAQCLAALEKAAPADVHLLAFAAR